MLFEIVCSESLLKLLKELQKDNLFKDYLLIGGTALSLQLGHRKSIDIDLVTAQEQDNNLILEFLKDNYNNITVENNKKNILQVHVNDIKVDFVKATGKLIKEPICENGIRLCDKEDIAGMKLNAISRETGRREIKDYIDIAYLINELTLPKMFDIYKWKYDKDDIYTLKQDLLDIEKINPYTWLGIDMIKEDINIFNVSKIIQNAIEQYNKENNYTVKRFFSFKNKHKP